RCVVTRPLAAAASSVLSLCCPAVCRLPKGSEDLGPPGVRRRRPQYLLTLGAACSTGDLVHGVALPPARSAQQAGTGGGPWRPGGGVRSERWPRGPALLCGGPRCNVLPDPHRLTPRRVPRRAGLPAPGASPFHRRWTRVATPSASSSAPTTSCMAGMRSYKVV